MAPPRLPRSKAKALGSDKVHPGRFEGREEPVVTDPIGAPPAWMTEGQANAWLTLAGDIPWLNRSHRTLLGIAAVIQARMESGDEVGVQAMNLLRQALGQMGATPADASKIGAQPNGEKADTGEEFFN